jgi:hypothetical protein
MKHGGDLDKASALWLIAFVLNGMCAIVWSNDKSWQRNGMAPVILE